MRHTEQQMNRQSAQWVTYPFAATDGRPSVAMYADLPTAVVDFGDQKTLQLQKLWLNRA